MEQPEDKLGLDDDDLDNMKTVMEHLVNVVAKFHSLDELTEGDYVDLKETLDFANFVVSGIIYSTGMDTCQGHDHDDDEGVE